MLGYTWRNWDAALNVRNIEDKDYFATCLARGDCFPGDQRSAVASLRYQF